jgi:hypothetical protein
VLIPQSQRDLEASRHGLALIGIQACVIHAAERQHDAEVAAFGEEHAVIHKAVEVDQRAHGAGIPVVLHDLRQTPHGRSFRCTVRYSNFPGS